MLMFKCKCMKEKKEALHKQQIDSVVDEGGGEGEKPQQQRCVRNAKHEENE